MSDSAFLLCSMLRPLLMLFRCSVRQWFVLLQITDYLDVIKDPIDLTMIEKRLNQPNTFYKTKVDNIPYYHGHERKIAAA